MNEYINHKAKVIAHAFKEDHNYTISRKYVDECIGKTGVIADYSDSHGLCYGLVFPNLHGNAGRTDSLTIYWFEPEEIEIK